MPIRKMAMWILVGQVLLRCMLAWHFCRLAEP